MRNKGYTLLEVLLVVSIVSIISVFAAQTLIKFQKEAVLDDTVREFSSLTLHARSKSIAGEIQKGKTYNDYAEEGMDEYAIKTTSDSYQLVRRYTLASATEQENIIESNQINNVLDFEPKNTTVFFDRISGQPSSATQFTFQIKGSSEQRLVKINSNGSVNIEKL